MPDRFLCVTYCDDIRHEAGNKISYMGIYRRDMFVPEIPFTVPKFCVAVEATTVSDNPFGNLVFSVLYGDDVLYRQEIPESDIEALREANQELNAGGDDDARVQVLRVFLQITPFEIKREEVLRVVLDDNGKLLKGAPLRISKAPQPT